MTNDFEVRAEMILPKFDIARTTRRQKIAGKYSARFPDALERQIIIASNVPFSLQNAASEKKITDLKSSEFRCSIVEDCHHVLRTRRRKRPLSTS